MNFNVGNLHLGLTAEPSTHYKAVLRGQRLRASSAHVKVPVQKQAIIGFGAKYSALG